ncbi:hypothetical protein P5G62_015200 [Neobacillus sp. 179-C4.2 HS]|uniref:SH3 domain-containing protein n=1 Tax=Neobacillus driksii TaxID=3035913 RepID=A0ABV4YUS9_9BACI|nr:hypothetical protein [Neobacillus sp. 179.-C4.2 HS]MDP5192771.1 hypothetical protein [Neobacillus sp. 179.-C4.2 HS]
MRKNDIRTIAKSNFDNVLTSVKTQYRVKSTIANTEIMVALDNGDDIEIVMVNKFCSSYRILVWNKSNSKKGYILVDTIGDIESTPVLMNHLRELKFLYDVKLYDYYSGWDINEGPSASWYVKEVKKGK